MSGQLKVLLAIAVMILGIGAYIVFVEGEVIGVVLMGLATTFSALAAVIGAQAKKQKEDSDAG